MTLYLQVVKVQSSSSSPKDNRLREAAGGASFLTSSFSFSSIFSRLPSRPEESLDDGLLTLLNVLTASSVLRVGFRYLYLPGVRSFRSEG